MCSSFRLVGASECRNRSLPLSLSTLTAGRDRARNLFSVIGETFWSLRYQICHITAFYEDLVRVQTPDTSDQSFRPPPKFTFNALQIHLSGSVDGTRQVLTALSPSPFLCEPNQYTSRTPFKSRNSTPNGRPRLERMLLHGQLIWSIPTFDK